MPSRATVLPNDAGSAPGFALEKDGKRIIAMPGPPREMTRMFDLQVRPLLESLQDSVIYYRLIRTFGLGESVMETMLLPLIDGQTDPTLATYAKEGECSLRIASKRATKEEAIEAVDEIEKKVREIIGDYIYSNNDEDLINVVGKLLLEKNITISCAESCTGGKLAAALCEIPGISKVFERGIVTYSNRAKMEELGVKAGTLEKHGAVSPETAEEMVRGLAAKTGSDLCISITGIAGPDGGTEEKPVGLSYIGISYKGEVKVVKNQRKSSGGRKWTQNAALLAMLYQIYCLIK